MYKENSIVVLKAGERDSEDLTFGQINKIYIAGDSVHAYVRVMLITEYSEHYCVFVLSYTPDYIMTELSSLASHLPLSPYTLNSFPQFICISPKFVLR